MMGVDTKKPTKPTSVESVKMPPLDPPTWLNEVAHDLLADEAPHVGPQVSWFQIPDPILFFNV